METFVAYYQPPHSPFISCHLSNWCFNEDIKCPVTVCLCWPVVLKFRSMSVHIYTTTDAPIASCENQMGLNVQNALAYLDVTSSWDQKRVVWGEVQICYPASMQRVHAILTVPGTNLQQGPILDTPELWCTVTHYKSSNKQMLGPINN